MSKITTAYGQWLSKYNWSHIITIRLHYRLTEISARNLGQRLFKGSQDVVRLFYSVEKDRQDNMNHMHLIIQSNDPNLSREKVAKAAGLGKNPKAISYIQPADSREAVSMYVTKSVGRNDVDHGFEGCFYI